jgi:hypothetical protein
MHEQQISPDGDGSGPGKRDHGGGKSVNPGGDGMFGRLLMLQARDLQQIVVSCALLGIAEDFAGMNDLPEFQRSVWIARSEVGMGPFDGSTECGPETFSVIVWKSLEQIVKRFHYRSRSWISSAPSEILAANLLRSTHTNSSPRLWIMLIQYGRKMTFRICRPAAACPIGVLLNRC